jgi:hypothetical protein
LYAIEGARKNNLSYKEIKNEKGYDCAKVIMKIKDNGDTTVLALHFNLFSS